MKKLFLPVFIILLRCISLADSLSVSFTPPELKILQGEAIQLKPIIANGDTARCIYTWAPLNGLNSGRIREPIARPEQTTNYQLTVMDSAGNIRIKSIKVSVVPLLKDILFTQPQSTTILPGSSATLQFRLRSTEGITIRWQKKNINGGWDDIPNTNDTILYLQNSTTKQIYRACIHSDLETPDINTNPATVSIYSISSELKINGHTPLGYSTVAPPSATQDDIIYFRIKAGNGEYISLNQAAVYQIDIEVGGISKTITLTEGEKERTTYALYLNTHEITSLPSGIGTIIIKSTLSLINTDNYFTFMNNDVIPRPIAINNSTKEEIILPYDPNSDIIPEVTEADCIKISFTRNGKPIMVKDANIVKISLNNIPSPSIEQVLQSDSVKTINLKDFDFENGQKVVLTIEGTRSNKSYYFTYLKINTYDWWIPLGLFSLQHNASGIYTAPYPITISFGRRFYHNFFHNNKVNVGVSAYITSTSRVIDDKSYMETFTFGGLIDINKSLSLGVGWLISSKDKIKGENFVIIGGITGELLSIVKGLGFSK
jgi:hypothetical protein